MDYEKKSPDIVISIIPPLCQKVFLTIEEAAEYFPIGKNKLRSICEQNAELAVKNGNRLIVNRLALENFLQKKDRI